MISASPCSTQKSVILSLASEIQGEAGSLVIEKLSECQKVCFVPRGSQMQDLTQPQHINTMLYEAELFATPGG